MGMATAYLPTLRDFQPPTLHEVFMALMEGTDDLINNQAASKGVSQ